MALLEVRNLQIDFGRGPQALRAVDGVSLSIEGGQTLGLVGESGSGKTVTALAIARLLATPPAQYANGEIILEGRDVLKMPPNELRSIRGGTVSYVFQNPSASLNPVFRVGSQIKEALKLHRPDAASDTEVARLLELVGVSAPVAKRYPHELSGGMQQRVMIAIALAPQPRLLVADEPTTALDVTVQAQIIELLHELQKQFDMAILLITHNLGIVGDLADHVAVMYAGQIVETAPTMELLTQPLHPYTRALIDSVPDLSQQNERLLMIPGAVPSLGAFPAGCRFHPRCPRAIPECAQKPPALIEAKPHRWTRCPLWNTTGVHV
jgi:oligopeptide/dipeptide ABC transporter ATP-binding protein